MIVGFTGTREGMTEKQWDTVSDLLIAELYRAIASEDTLEAHSGDCVGADAEFHQLAYCLGYRTVGHIPLKDAQRAFCTYDEEREPLDYLERDRNIAAECDLLIGTPKDFKQSGGTWYTINFADSIKRRTAIVGSDGWIDWMN